MSVAGQSVGGKRASTARTVVVDVGCGVGFWPPARLVRRAASVIAIAIAIDMNNQVQARDRARFGTRLWPGWGAATSCLRRSLQVSHTDVR